MKNKVNDCAPSPPAFGHSAGEPKKRIVAAESISPGLLDPVPLPPAFTCSPNPFNPSTEPFIRSAPNATLAPSSVTNAPHVADRPSAGFPLCPSVRVLFLRQEASLLESGDSRLGLLHVEVGVYEQVLQAEASRRLGVP